MKHFNFFKLTFAFVAMAAVSFTAASCDNDDNGNGQSEQITITVSPSTTLSFSAENAEDQTLTIETNADVWSVTLEDTEDTWTMYSQNGNTLTVGVWDNSAYESRTSKIIITAGSNASTAQTVTVTVTQAALGRNTLTLSAESLEFGYNDTEVKIVEISTDVAEWDYTNDADWLNITKDGNNLNISVTNNPGDERNTVITVTAGTEEVSISIEQAGYALNTTVSYASADGIYYGKTEAYTGKFEINFNSASNETIRIVAYSDLFAVPDKFIPADGTYSAAANSTDYAINTYEIGEAYGSDGITEFNVSAGTFTVTYDNSAETYKIEGELTLTTLENEVIDNFTFSYEGAVAFENQSEDEITYYDINTESASKYYADFYTEGAGQFSFKAAGTLIDYTTGKYGLYSDAIYTDLASNPSLATLPAGVYRIRDTKEAGTITTGYKDATNMYRGTFIYRAATTGTYRAATVAEYGTLVVEKDSDNYTITAYFVGKDIYGTSTAMVESAVRFTGSLSTSYVEPVSSYTFAFTYSGMSGTLNKNSTTGYKIMTFEVADSSSSTSDQMKLELYSSSHNYVTGIAEGTYSVTTTTGGDADMTFKNGVATSSTYATGSYVKVYESGSATQDFITLQSGTATVTKTVDNTPSSATSTTHGYSVSFVGKGIRLSDLMEVDVNVSYDGTIYIYNIVQE